MAVAALHSRMLAIAVQLWLTIPFLSSADTNLVSIAGLAGHLPAHSQS